MTTSRERANRALCCGDSDDHTWGRLPGAEPPLRWWLPIAGFGVAVLVLTPTILLGVGAPGPLDDPDPAAQRDALLLDGPRLPPEVGGVSLGDRPVVVLFERERPTGAKYSTWRADVADVDVEVAVVVDGSPGAAALAAAVGIPTPVDGGFPIGYAVIDSARVVRYATLDPTYAQNAFEVEVIAGAVR